MDVGVLFRRDMYPTSADRFDAGVRLAGWLVAELRQPMADLVVLNDAPPGLAAARGRRGAVPQARPPDQAGGAEAVTAYMVERLAELRRQLDHLRALRPRVRDATALGRDLSLHNDVLFSLLTVCQLVIDIAGDLSARRGDRFEDYTHAIRNLARDTRFPPDPARPAHGSVITGMPPPQSWRRECSVPGARSPRVQGANERPMVAAGLVRPPSSKLSQ